MCLYENGFGVAAAFAVVARMHAHFPRVWCILHTHALAVPGAMRLHCREVLYRSAEERCCGEALEKSFVEKCWARVLQRSVKFKCRRRVLWRRVVWKGRLLESVVEKCWRREECSVGGECKWLRLKRCGSSHFGSRPFRLEPSWLGGLLAGRLYRISLP